jgi:tetratricopeptide (TPR) repeat protein
LGKSAEAVKLLADRAQTAEQHDELAWFCLRERTSYERGLHHARRAVALDSRRASAWANLAELELRLGQRRAAETHWARARALDPRNPRTRGPLPAVPQP